MDYVPLKDSDAVGRVSTRLAPAQLAAGLFGLATLGVSASFGIMTKFRTSENNHLPFFPKQNMQAVLARSSNPGLLPSLLHSWSGGPCCIFRCAPDESMDRATITTAMSSREEGYVYGARLANGVARPTGKQGDILKGYILCYHANNMREQLLTADKIHNYTTTTNTQGALLTAKVRRGVVAVILKNGETKQAYWYYQPPFRHSAWSPRGVYANRTDMPPLPIVSAKLGVAAPWTAPRWVWSRAWKLGKHSLPFLHRWDACSPTDTNVNLLVLWLKAIAGNRRETWDERIAYDLLPDWTRGVVSPAVAWMYPKLHHQNIVLRTEFLDQAVSLELNRYVPGRTVVVVLGAGFDGRALRLQGPSAAAATWVEVDLPHVSKQKQCLLGRLRARRPDLLGRLDALRFLLANLTSEMEVRSVLAQAVIPEKVQGGRVIFVLEALLIYLPPDRAAALLAACQEVCAAAGASTAVLCFADKLPHVEGCAVGQAQKMLAGAGWTLEEDSWLPKPGLARHMGCARWRKKKIFNFG
eukprot:gb/GEZN01006457.1/.p1 GENE.gb/GEZN01006457.1/~~gb/GEZN01006457.1/.p1  ORF type:complete len:526 (-),score=56.76 gb/GEZN01006457.1/:64-1641(-)